MAADASDVSASANSSPGCTRVLLTRVATSEQGREGYAAQNKRAARVREPLTLVVARLVFLETAIGGERQTAQHLASSNAPDDGPAWNVRCHTRHADTTPQTTVSGEPRYSPHQKLPHSADQKHLRRTDASCSFRLEEGSVLGVASKPAHSLTIGKAGKNSTRFEVVVGTDEYRLERRADLKTQLFFRVERYPLRTFSRRTNSVGVPTSGSEREREPRILRRRQPTRSLSPRRSGRAGGRRWSANAEISTSALSCRPEKK